jgi:hypothetical protein
VRLTSAEKERYEHTDSSVGQFSLKENVSNIDSVYEFRILHKEGEGKRELDYAKQYFEDINSSVSDLAGIISVADRSLKENSLYSVASRELYDRGLKKGFFTRKELTEHGIPAHQARQAKVSTLPGLELGRLGRVGGRTVQVTPYDLAQAQRQDSEVSDFCSQAARSDSNVHLVLQGRRLDLSGENSDLALEEMRQADLSSVEGYSQYREDELAEVDSGISSLLI